MKVKAIKILNEEHSKFVQELLMDNGYNWRCGDYVELPNNYAIILNEKKKRLTCASNDFVESYIYKDVITTDELIEMFTLNENVKAPEVNTNDVDILVEKLFDKFVEHNGFTLQYTHRNCNLTEPVHQRMSRRKKAKNCIKDFIQKFVKDSKEKTEPTISVKLTRDELENILKSVKSTYLFTKLNRAYTDLVHNIDCK